MPYFLVEFDPDKADFEEAEKHLMRDKVVKSFVGLSEKEYEAMLRYKPLIGVVKFVNTTKR